MVMITESRYLKETFYFSLYYDNAPVLGTESCYKGFCSFSGMNEFGPTSKKFLFESISLVVPMIASCKLKATFKKSTQHLFRLPLK